MKKIAPIAALALFAVAFTSCKKEYKCTCKATVNGQVVMENTVNLGKQTKKDAESACDQQASTTSGPSGSSATVDCNLD